MKNVTRLCCTAALFLGATAQAAVVNYGAIELNPGYEATHYSDVWDLTQGDLVLSYSADMSTITQNGAGQSPYLEVGLRQIGAGDFNPGPWNTYQGGAGGWMGSSVGDLTASPNGQSLMDKHNLSASGGSWGA